jgi:hypothetical protein
LPNYESDSSRSNICAPLDHIRKYFPTYHTYGGQIQILTQPPEVLTQSLYLLLIRTRTHRHLLIHTQIPRLQRNHIQHLPLRSIPRLLRNHILLRSRLAQLPTRRYLLVQTQHRFFQLIDTQHPSLLGGCLQVTYRHKVQISVLDFRKLSKMPLGAMTRADT